MREREREGGRERERERVPASQRERERDSQPARERERETRSQPERLSVSQRERWEIGRLPNVHITTDDANVTRCLPTASTTDPAETNHHLSTPPARTALPALRWSTRSNSGSQIAGPCGRKSRRRRHHNRQLRLPANSFLLDCQRVRSTNAQRCPMRYSQKLPLPNT